MPFRVFPFAVLPILAAAQPPGLDQGRLDPAWFGTAVAFQPAKTIDWMWLKPGLDLRGRSIRVLPWEAPAWRGRKRADKDRAFLRGLEGTLESGIESALRTRLGSRTAISRGEGELLLAGRAVDAVGPDEGGSFFTAVSLTFDLKLLDAVSGELLGAFHHTVSSMSESNWASLFADWCGDLGRVLAENPKSSPPAALPPAPKPVPAPPPKPNLDLDATLRRLDALRRDGILTEDGYAALRRKAEELAGVGKK